jgi:hypothetical protein
MAEILESVIGAAVDGTLKCNGSPSFRQIGFPYHSVPDVAAFAVSLSLCLCKC